MGALFKFLGFLFLVAVAVGVYYYNESLKMERESATYIQAKQPAVIVHWDEHAFLEELHPQVAKQHSRGELDSMFAGFARLGNLVKAEPPKGKTIEFFPAMKGQPWRAIYITHAEFEHGKATIAVEVAKDGDSWKMTDILVSSPLFGMPANGAPQNRTGLRTPVQFNNPLNAPVRK